MSRVVGYQCQMCGTWFLLRSRFDAHREAEIPGFAEAARAKNTAYEAGRRDYRPAMAVRVVK